MKISTRNLLAELMIEALDDPVAAAALHCLASYCHSSKQTPLVVTVEQLLKPASPPDREAVLARLQANPLLAWDRREGSGQVTLSADFLAEWPVIASKLARFSSALQEWSPQENDTPRQHALKKGAVLFNHQLFFEVHEVLEAQWMKESGKEKLFLQGLIQIAVAFHHRERGNVRGALALLHDGVEKIAPHRPAFLGVELEEFIQRLQACQDEILRCGESALSQFSAIKIPPLQIIGV